MSLEKRSSRRERVSDPRDRRWALSGVVLLQFGGVDQWAAMGLWDRNGHIALLVYDFLEVATFREDGCLRVGFHHWHKRCAEKCLTARPC